MKPREEALGDALPVKALGQMLLQRLIGALAEAVVVEFGPRGSDDPQIVGKQPVGVEPVERGQKHAPGKVAGRSEHQQGRSLLDHGVSYRE